MNVIRRHLASPAMIVACAALIIALGGVSYAAAVLPKNSVGTAQLQRKAVSRAKLKNNAVTADKVKDGSLLAADFKAGQVPAASQGPKGDPGPQGPKGDSGSAGSPGTARAYGLVSHLGTVSRSHNVVSVSQPSLGITCIGLDPSIDISNTEAVVTPDNSHDSTAFPTGTTSTIAEVVSSRSECPGKIEVKTGYQIEDSSGSSDGDVRHVINESAFEGFFFIVP